MSQQGNRAYSTMPSASQRNSMPVAMPYQNGNLLRTPSYGSSINTPPSPHVESSGNQFGQAGGEPDEYRSKRYSSMTTGTFGLRDRDQLESLAEHDQVCFSRFQGEPGANPAVHNVRTLVQRNEDTSGTS